MLALLGREAMRRLSDAHTANGLSPRQFQLLGLLHDRGPTGQRDLGHMMGIAASIVVTQLNPLESAGLLVRERDRDDRRRHTIALTDLGRTRLQAASHAQRQVEDALFAALSPHQRTQLRNILTLVRDDLTDGHDHCATPAALDPR